MQTQRADPRQEFDFHSPAASYTAHEEDPGGSRRQAYAFMFKAIIAVGRDEVLVPCGSSTIQFVYEDPYGFSEARRLTSSQMQHDMSVFEQHDAWIEKALVSTSLSSLVVILTTLAEVPQFAPISGVGPHP